MAGSAPDALNVVQQVGQGVPSDIGQATAQAKGAAQFKQLAALGGFGISQEGFDTLIKAIHNGQDMMPQLKQHLSTVKYGMALGTAPVALQVAEFDQSIATGDLQSLESVLNLYEQTLHDVEAGLTQALRNYQTGEDNNVNALKQVLGNDA